MWLTNRLQAMNPDLSSPRNLRVGAVLLVFAAMNQLKEPLVGASIGQEIVYNGCRFLALAVGLLIAEWVNSSPGSEARSAYRWLRPVVLGTLIAVAPFSLADMLLEPHFPVRQEYVDDYQGPMGTVVAFLGEYLTMVSLLLPVQLFVWVIVDARAGAVSGAERALESDAAPADREPIPDFLRRAGVATLEDVLALEADEHYVRVHTKAGSDMVLQRFSSAIDSLPESAGLRVHRSWWVANAAVESARRGARRWQLRLTSGLEVNVSDSYLDRVRDRGWLNKKR